MAHMVETMAYAGEVPWHGLGVPVSNDLDPNGMLQAAGLDWSVETIPTFYKYDGKQAKTNKSALVRSSDGKLLDVISNDWKPVQNTEAFEFFSDFVSEGHMEMHTAGSLNDGRMVWALAKVKESFSLFKGKDEVDSYLLFSNPHQYGRSIDIRFTPIRVVCNNTLTLSLSSKSDLYVRLNHRKEFDAELVKQTMGMAHEKLSTYKEMAEFLGSKFYKPENVDEYLSRVFPVTGKKVDELSKPASVVKEVLATQPGAEYGEGTFWQLFNGVTYATDHLLGRSLDTRLQSAWYGQNRNRKLLALDTAVEMANAA